MQKAVVVIFPILFSLCTLAQEFYPVNSSTANDTVFADLAKIDLNRTLIGVGEATHGTQEFQTMRHRLFRHLVTDRGFTTLYMEADYAICLDIDRFIRGEYKDDKIDSLVFSLKLWPWVTQEMKAFIQWMRSYNLSNPVRKIRFVGVDMQYNSANFWELRRIYSKYKLDWEKDYLLDTFSQLEYKHDFTKEENTLIENCIRTIEHTLENSVLGIDDLQNAAQLIRTLRMCFAGEQQDAGHGFRDSCMAANILSDLFGTPGNRGMFWAHNGHVANIYKGAYGNTSAGYFLKRQLGDRYLTIGQDFYKGKFNAMRNSKKKNEYRFHKFKAPRPAKGSLADELRKVKQPVFFMKNNQLKGDLPLTSIGAVFGRRDKSYRYSGFLKLEYFDCFIFHKRTTPTSLLY